MLIKLFSKIFELPKRRLYNCSVMGCDQTTDGRFQEDSHKRWMLGAKIGEGVEEEIVNICPLHIKQFCGLTEQDYKAIELGENLATGKMEVGEWKNAISSIR
jgi:hypothetical protein